MSWFREISHINCDIEYQNFFIVRYLTKIYAIVRYLTGGKVNSLEKPLPQYVCTQTIFVIFKETKNI